jgi:hypothetical protein
MSQQGTTGVIQQATSYSGDIRGVTTTVAFVGAHADAFTQFGTYRVNGWQTTLNPISGSPRSVMTATVRNESDTVITIWELDVQWSQVSAEECVKFYAYLATLADDAARGTKLALVFAAVDEIRNDHASTKFAALGATDKLWALSFVRGDVVWEPAAVLRRVNQYPSFTTKTADWVDVDKVWTVAQLTTGAGAHTPPSAIAGTLPAGSYWLKTSAGIAYAENGSFTVTTHWIKGNFPSHLYDYK